MRTRWVWITWEKHRRTRELCTDLGIRLCERDTNAPRILRYPWLLLWTAATVAWLRPRGVIVQNPSIVLAVWAIVLRYLFRYALIVDAHNEGLRPIYQPLGWLDCVFRFVQAKADLTLVTNDLLVDGVNRNGGIAFVLPDRLPALPDVPALRLEGQHSIVCISTFAKDEPIDEVIAAVAGLDPRYRLYMTGNSRRLASDLSDRLPANLILTGYLSDTDYVALLRGADVVLDLTHLDNCLVCGAYEAVALGKPLIVSDTAVLRRYFYKGTIYTKNHPQEIRDAVHSAVSNRATLRHQMISLKQELIEDWSIKRTDLLRLMDTLLRSSSPRTRMGPLSGCDAR
jgi:glycosyltransferase involved in cell wall biosynthesis